MSHHNTDIVAKDKQEVAQAAEPTRPGRVFSPDVDIFERENGIVIMADMPGVAADGLSIDLQDSVLTINGETTPQEADNEMDVFREYATGRYFRQFTLGEAIDQGGIEANLKNGVLRLTLPKVEKARPRKITVSSA